MRKSKGRLAASALTAIALSVPFGGISAWADSAASGSIDANFQAQYQQNAALENQLLQSVQSYKVTTARTLRLQATVTLLNKQIAALYQEEQALAAKINAQSGQNQDSQQQLNALINQRNQWIAQLRALSAQLAKADVHVSVQGEWNIDLRWSGHGQDKNGKHGQGGNAANIKAWLQQLHNITVQLVKVDKEIAKLRSSIERDHDDDLLKQLKSVESKILHLQKEAIADLKLWLRIVQNSGSGGGSGGSGGVPGNIATVSVKADGAEVIEGGVLTYTAQLTDQNGQPVHQAGVKIDFAFVGSNNDGTLWTTSAYTNADGQATVHVTAGSNTGQLQVSASVDGTTLPAGTSAITQVVDAAHYATQLAVTSNGIPTTLTVGQTVTGTVVVPESAAGQVVAGDILQVATSDPNVLALAAPDTSGGNTQTLPAGAYTLPVITANSAGTATLTVTDISAVDRPKLSFTVHVNTAAPYKLMVGNPDGSLNTSYNISTAGVAGPFTVKVADQNGNVVPTSNSIFLTASQVNAIIGAGTGVRLGPTGPDVTGVWIPAGQSSVSVYVDNAAAGNTAPSSLILSSIVPSVNSVQVKDSNTVVITYNEPLDSTKVPSATDFFVNWGTGSGTPKAVAVAGNTVTLTLWGNPIQHGSAVSVSYTQGTDPNALRTVWGGLAANLANVAAINVL